MFDTGAVADLAADVVHITAERSRHDENRRQGSGRAWVWDVFAFGDASWPIHLMGVNGYGLPANKMAS